MTNSGTYLLTFPAGTFSGSEGKFLLATVTPIGTNVAVIFMSSIAPVQPDGRGFFEVQFTRDVSFTFVIAVQIS